MDLLNNNNLYLSTLIMGLSCSTTCNQIVMFFLGTWISGSESDAKKGLKDSLYFLSGKAGVYMVLAVLSSIVGTELQHFYKNIVGSNGAKVFSIFLIILGGYCILKFFMSIKNKVFTCKSKNQYFDVTPSKAFVAGIIYGISPCFPMTVLMINAAMVSLLQALLLGIIFSLTSFINPLLIVGMISGKVSQVMRKDIAQFVTYFQLVFAISFVVIGISCLLS